jgi:hypothetical protein
MSTTTAPRKISQVKTVYRLLDEALSTRNIDLAQEVHRNVFDWLCDEDEKDALLTLISQIQESIGDLQDFHGDNDE